MFIYICVYIWPRSAWPGAECSLQTKRSVRSPEQFDKIIQRVVCKLIPQTFHSEVGPIALGARVPRVPVDAYPRAPTTQRPGGLPASLQKPRAPRIGARQWRK